MSRNKIQAPTKIKIKIKIKIKRLPFYYSTCARKLLENMIVEYESAPTFATFTLENELPVLKNIGYLYAIYNGAKMIFDSDDNIDIRYFKRKNVFYSPHELSNTKIIELRELNPKKLSYNWLKIFMGNNHVYPRGHINEDMIQYLICDLNPDSQLCKTLENDNKDVTQHKPFWTDYQGFFFFFFFFFFFNLFVVSLSMQ